MLSVERSNLIFIYVYMCVLFLEKKYIYIHVFVLFPEIMHSITTVAINI